MKRTNFFLSALFFLLLDSYITLCNIHVLITRGFGQDLRTRDMRNLTVARIKICVAPQIISCFDDTMFSREFKKIQIVLKFSKVQKYEETLQNSENTTRDFRFSTVVCPLMMGCTAWQMAINLFLSFKLSPERTWKNPKSDWFVIQAMELDDVNTAYKYLNQSVCPAVAE